MAMSFDLPTVNMTSSATALRLCSKCAGNTYLVNIIRRFGDRPETQIIECRECRHHDFYALTAGALEKM
jgi:hypothetical protein